MAEFESLFFQLGMTFHGMGTNHNPVNFNLNRSVKSVCRKLQVAILARLSLEMSQTVRID